MRRCFQGSPVRTLPKCFVSLLAGLLTLAILDAGAAGATDYYVNVASGGDENTGQSESQAWQTIARASRAAQPGDTVWIAGGPQPYQETLRPRTSGTPTARIHYRGYGETERPRITNDGSLARQGDCMLLQDIEHVVISNLHCDGAGGDPFGFFAALWSSSRNEIRDCVFTGPAFGIVLGTSNRRGSSYNKLIGNLVHPTGPRTRGGSGIESIQIQAHSQHNLVEGNDVRDGGHDSLQVKSSYNVIRGNRFTNPDWRAVGIAPVNTHEPGYDPAESNVFEDNQVSGSFLIDGRHGNAVQSRAPRTIFRYNRFFQNGGNGIKITRFQRESTTPDLRDNRIYHNVFYRNGMRGHGPTTGFLLHIRSKRGNTGGTVLMNNVFLENDENSALQIGVGGDAARGLEGTVIRSNVILNQRPGEWTIGVNVLDLAEPRALASVPCDEGGKVRTPATVREFESCYPALVAGNHEGDPEFVDPPRGDFRPRPTSPLIDAGAFLTRATGAGLGTEIPVQDARFFSDGRGIVSGDAIRLEGGTRARIVSVDYERDRLKVDRPLKFEAGQGVHLDFAGKAPDIGAHELSGPSDAG